MEILFALMIRIYTRSLFSSTRIHIKTLHGWNLTKILAEQQCLSFLFLFILDQCGDLSDLYDIESCSIYNENYLSPLVQQLLEAVKYMHDLSIVHRNIILQNVLVRLFSNNNKFLFYEIICSLVPYGTEADIQLPLKRFPVKNSYAMR